MPSLAVGDFNCYIGQSGVKKKTGTFEDCIKEFEAHGMKSAYHTNNNEEFGKEHEATFFWRYNEHSPYFLDYAFSNIVGCPVRCSEKQYQGTSSDSPSW